MGGNDLDCQGNCNPAAIADQYIQLYKYAASTVIFCSVFYRSNPTYVTPETFRERAHQFNARLKARTDILYFKHGHLHTDLCGDGVHLNDHGYHRLFLAFRAAIRTGGQTLQQRHK